jgi:hypothetical protein
VAHEYDAELVAQGLQTLLEAEMEDALDTVEAAWVTNGDAVTLPDVVMWHFGHKPTVLEMGSDAFPFVSTIPAGANPDTAKRAEWGFQEETFQVMIDYFVVGTTEEICTKVCNRYAQAIRAILQTQRNIEGYQQVNWKPQVAISEIIRHGVTTESDLLVSAAAAVNYIQGGRITVVFEGG